jgi:hypothetical protein
MLTVQKRSATFTLTNMAIPRHSIACLFVLLQICFVRAYGTESILLRADAEEAGTGLSNWLVADFDGDHIPDLAIGRSGVNWVQVDIRLSAESSQTSIRHGRAERGLRVLAYDVDRDDDQDLIFASSSSLSPPTVWLNDGKGHFERSERRNELNLIDEGSSWLEIDCFQAEPVPVTQDDDRPSLDRSSSLRVKPAPELKGPFSSSWENLAIEPRTLLLAPRSPPPTSILLS